MVLEAYIIIHVVYESACLCGVCVQWYCTAHSHLPTCTHEETYETPTEGHHSSAPAQTLIRHHTRWQSARPLPLYLLVSVSMSPVCRSCCCSAPPKK